MGSCVEPKGNVCDKNEKLWHPIWNSYLSLSPHPLIKVCVHETKKKKKENKKTHSLFYIRNSGLIVILEVERKKFDVIVCMLKICRESVLTFKVIRVGIEIFILFIFLLPAVRMKWKVILVVL